MTSLSSKGKLQWQSHPTPSSHSQHIVIIVFLTIMTRSLHAASNFTVSVRNLLTLSVWRSSLPHEVLNPGEVSCLSPLGLISCKCRCRWDKLSLVSSTLADGSVLLDPSASRSWWALLQRPTLIIKNLWSSVTKKHTLSHTLSLTHSSTHTHRRKIVYPCEHFNIFETVWICFSVLFSSLCFSCPLLLACLSSFVASPSFSVV